MKPHLLYAFLLFWFLAVAAQLSAVASDLNAALNLPAAPRVTIPSSQGWIAVESGSAAHDGIAAVRLSAGDSGGQIAIATTFNGPGRLTFWWRMVSPGDGDRADFGGNSYTASAATAVWAQHTEHLDAAAASYTWRYSKTSQSVGGVAALWIDEVRFTPLLAHPPATINDALDWSGVPWTVTGSTQTWQGLAAPYWASDGVDAIMGRPGEDGQLVNRLTGPAYLAMLWRSESISTAPFSSQNLQVTLDGDNEFRRFDGPGPWSALRLWIPPGEHDIALGAGSISTGLDQASLEPVVEVSVCEALDCPAEWVWEYTPGAVLAVHPPGEPALDEVRFLQSGEELATTVTGPGILRYTGGRLGVLLDDQWITSSQIGQSYGAEVSTYQFFLPAGAHRVAFYNVQSGVLERVSLVKLEPVSYKEALDTAFDWFPGNSSAGIGAFFDPSAGAGPDQDFLGVANIGNDESRSLTAVLRYPQVLQSPSGQQRISPAAGHSVVRLEHLAGSNDVTLRWSGSEAVMLESIVPGSAGNTASLARALDLVDSGVCWVGANASPGAGMGISIFGFGGNTVIRLRPHYYYGSKISVGLPGAGRMVYRWRALSSRGEIEISNAAGIRKVPFTVDAPGWQETEVAVTEAGWQEFSVEQETSSYLIPQPEIEVDAWRWIPQSQPAGHVYRFTNYHPAGVPGWAALDDSGVSWSAVSGIERGIATLPSLPEEGADLYRRAGLPSLQLQNGGAVISAMAQFPLVLSYWQRDIGVRSGDSGWQYTVRRVEAGESIRLEAIPDTVRYLAGVNAQPEVSLSTALDDEGRVWSTPSPVLSVGHVMVEAQGADVVYLAGDLASRITARVTGPVLMEYSWKLLTATVAPGPEVLVDGVPANAVNYWYTRNQIDNVTAHPPARWYRDPVLIPPGEHEVVIVSRGAPALVDHITFGPQPSWTGVLGSPVNVAPGIGLTRLPGSGENGEAVRYGAQLAEPGSWVESTVSGPAMVEFSASGYFDVTVDGGEAMPFELGVDDIDDVGRGLVEISPGVHTLRWQHLPNRIAKGDLHAIHVNTAPDALFASTLGVSAADGLFWMELHEGGEWAAQTDADGPLLALRQGRFSFRPHLPGRYQLELSQPEFVWDPLSFFFFSRSHFDYETVQIERNAEIDLLPPGQWFNASAALFPDGRESLGVRGTVHLRRLRGMDVAAALPDALDEYSLAWTRPLVVPDTAAPMTDSGASHDGVDVLRLQGIGSSPAAAGSIETSVPTAGRLGFWWKQNPSRFSITTPSGTGISTMLGYDSAPERVFSINDMPAVQPLSIAANCAGDWQYAEAFVPAGGVVRIVQERGLSWVDEVVWRPGEPTIRDALDTPDVAWHARHPAGTLCSLEAGRAGSDGVTLSGNTSLSAGFYGPRRLSLWYRGAAEIAIGHGPVRQPVVLSTTDDGEWHQWTGDAVAAGECVLELAGSGVTYDAVTFSDLVPAPPIPLSELLDTPGWTWTTGGNANITAGTAIPDAVSRTRLEFSFPSPTATSWLETTVSGPVLMTCLAASSSTGEISPLLVTVDGEPVPVSMHEDSKHHGWLVTGTGPHVVRMTIPAGVLWMDGCRLEPFLHLLGDPRVVWRTGGRMGVRLQYVNEGYSPHEILMFRHPASPGWVEGDVTGPISLLFFRDASVLSTQVTMDGLAVATGSRSLRRLDIPAGTHRVCLTLPTEPDAAQGGSIFLHLRNENDLRTPLLGNSPAFPSLAYNYWDVAENAGPSGQPAVAGFYGKLHLGVTGPGRLTFWWKAGGLPAGGLRFSAPARPVHEATDYPNPELAGGTSWQQWTARIPAGHQVLTWDSLEDNSDEPPHDQASLADIRFTPSAPALPLPQPVGGTLVSEPEAGSPEWIGKELAAPGHPSRIVASISPSRQGTLPALALTLTGPGRLFFHAGQTVEQVLAGAASSYQPWPPRIQLDNGQERPLSFVQTVPLSSQPLPWQHLRRCSLDIPEGQHTVRWRAASLQSSDIASAVEVELIIASIEFVPGPSPVGRVLTQPEIPWLLAPMPDGQDLVSESDGGYISLAPFQPLAGAAQVWPQLYGSTTPGPVTVSYQSRMPGAEWSGIVEDSFARDLVLEFGSGNTIRNISLAPLARVSLGQALDNSNLDWPTTGELYGLTTTSAPDGIDAVLLDRPVSVQVSGPGLLSFTCTPGCAVFRDGRYILSSSGASRNPEFAIPSGPHLITFQHEVTYPSFGVSWLDQVRWSPTGYELARTTLGLTSGFTAAFTVDTNGNGNVDILDYAFAPPEMGSQQTVSVTPVMVSQPAFNGSVEQYAELRFTRRRGSGLDYQPQFSAPAYGSAWFPAGEPIRVLRTISEEWEECAVTDDFPLSGSTRLGRIQVKAAGP